MIKPVFQTNNSRNYFLKKLNPSKKTHSENQRMDLRNNSLHLQAYYITQIDFRGKPERLPYKPIHNVNDALEQWESLRYESI